MQQLYIYLSIDFMERRRNMSSGYAQELFGAEQQQPKKKYKNATKFVAPFHPYNHFYC